MIALGGPSENPYTRLLLSSSAGSLFLFFFPLLPVSFSGINDSPLDFASISVRVQGDVFSVAGCHCCRWDAKKTIGLFVQQSLHSEERLSLVMMAPDLGLYNFLVSKLPLRASDVVGDFVSFFLPSFSFPFFRQKERIEDQWMDGWMDGWI